MLQRVMVVGVKAGLGFFVNVAGALNNAHPLEAPIDLIGRVGAWLGAFVTSVETPAVSLLRF